MADLTVLLDAVAAGRPDAAARLLDAVYAELRRMAAGRLAAEAPGHTLDPTALVHEAYLRLGGPADPGRWDGRGHFFAAAAEAMRRVLVDHARTKRRDKRGGERRRVPLGDLAAARDDPDALLDVDEALGRFAAGQPDKAALVRLRFFAGLTTAEAADAMGVSVATAERWWAFARAWLYADLAGGTENPSAG